MGEQNNTIDNDSGRKWKLSYVIVVLAIVLAVLGFIAVSWHRISEQQALLPVQNLAKLEAEFQKYRKVNGAFPKDFAEINAKVWHKVPGSHLNNDPLTWQKDHYYYRIVANGQELALWAVPVGERRDEANTYFVVMSPTWRRAWKGAAVGQENLSKIKSVPSPPDLAALGMEEQKSVAYK